jgi:hypothetical protein
MTPLWEFVVRARRRGLAAPVVAVAAALTLATAAPVFGAENTVESWGGGVDVPMPVAGLSGVAAVAAGGEDDYALLSNGTAMSWGNDEYGEHGDGTSAIGGGAPGLATVGGKPALSGITALAAGTYHALALLNTGKVMAWGRNSSGQLGVGTTSGPEPCPSNLFCSRLPIEVSGLSGVVAIAANGSRSLALLGNGTVMSWGAGGADVPTAVSGLKKVVGISAGDEHSLALLENGTVMAWGANGSGQLGNGTTTSSAMPVAVSGLSGVVAIAAGREHSIALLKDGTVMAWGANDSGQLGNGTAIGSDVPVPVNALTEATALSAAGDSSFALLASGTIAAWGANGSGQLGDGSTTPSETPVAVSDLSEVAGISAGKLILAVGPPRPIVTEVSPQFGNSKSGGTTVTVTGVNFTEATAVDFGLASATSFTVNSDTKITAVSPAGTGSVDLTVTSAAGTSFASPADRFDYFWVPAVTKVSPASGSPGGGTTVTITGTHLSEATSVLFGTTAATDVTINSDTKITAISPAGTAGTVDVVVGTPDTSSPISKVDRFKYRPAVNGVSPNSGSTAGGTTVTVSGVGFAVGTTNTSFKFGTASSKSVNCSSTTTCTVVSPPHSAGSVDVKVTVNKVVSVKSVSDRYTYS